MYFAQIEKVLDSTDQAKNSICRLDGFQCFASNKIEGQHEQVSTDIGC